MTGRGSTGSGGILSAPPGNCWSGRSSIGPFAILSRLVFEAPPDLKPPHILGQHERKAVVHDGAALDTRTRLLDLNKTEEHTLRQLKNASAEALASECKHKRAAWEADRIEKNVAAGMSEEEAHRLVGMMLNARILFPSILLKFDDDELGEVTVGAVLADPLKYDEETLADPVDVAYGPNKAKVFVQENGDVKIYSFAHGLDAVFLLRYDFASIMSAINAAPEANAPDVLVKMIVFAHVTPVEQEKLIKHAAARGKVGVRALGQMIADARKERQEAEQTRERKRRNKQEIYLSDDLDDNLVDVEKTLINSTDVEIYQRGGFIVYRSLTPRKTHEGKEVLDKSISAHCRESLRPEQAKAALYYKFHPKLGWYQVYPPEELSGMLLKSVSKGYLVLRGIITTPTLRDDGTLLTTPGYDAATGLFFDNEGIDFGTIPENPTREDALAALKELKELIRLFPFADVDEASRSASRSVALARLLTGMIRMTLRNAPMFVYTAPEPRTGKASSMTSAR